MKLTLNLEWAKSGGEFRYGICVLEKLVNTHPKYLDALAWIFPSGGGQFSACVIDGNMTFNFPNKESAMLWCESQLGITHEP